MKTFKYKKYIAGGLIFLGFAVYFNTKQDKKQKQLSPSLEAAQSKIDLFVAEKESDWYEFDSHYGLVHKKNASRPMVWPEHPDGKFEMKTNNFGFRNDQSTLEKKAPNQKRIIIIGDSHIDGVVANSESVAAVLAKNNPSWDVLNAGVGTTNPTHYLLMFTKNLNLQLDVAIVVIYIGNDLGGMLAGTDQAFSNKRPPNYFSRLKKATADAPKAVWQGLNQSYLFQHFPEQKSLSIQLAVKRLQEIETLAGENQIQTRFLILPSKLEIEWALDEKTLNSTTETLGLSKEKILEDIEFLKKNLIAEAAKQKLVVYDTSTYFKEQPGEKFWKQDYHLNILGHKLLANFITTSTPPF